MLDTSTCETKEGQIPRELGAMDKALMMLGDELSQLGEQLASVLRVEINDKGAGAPQQELVPLASSIREYRERVETQANRLRSIRERLEL